MNVLYTTSDRILTAIGMKVEDLLPTDNPVEWQEFFMTFDLEDKLLIDFAGWLPDHATHYTDPPVLPTDTIINALLRMYCTSFGAAEVLLSELFIKSKVTDGNNAEDLLGNYDPKEARAQHLANTARYKAQLQALVNPAPPPVASLSVFGGVKRAYDPVTGV